MTDIVNNATIKVTADATGVEAGLRPAVDAAQRAGQAITQTGTRAAGAARAVEGAQRNIIASIQRTTAAMEAGGRTTAAYYETMATRKGVDPASLTPYLNQLRAVEAAQGQAAESARAQAAAARDLAQAQTNKESFIAGLREQMALFGKTADEVLRYRAAQAGASQESAMLILQLQNMRAAHEQVAAAARAQVAADREAAQLQANKESFLSGLREQVALFGKSADEVLRYRAAQAGATQEAAQLIAQLQSMRSAQEQVEAAARAAATAQREAAQLQANKESFLSGLREQVTLFGKSADEVLRYRAAQAGASQEAAQLILQLQNMRVVQEQVEAAARATAAAQREAVQAQANKDSFLAGLREQVSLFGKSADEVLRYRAAQAGASQEAAQLILQLQNMRAAQEQVETAARAAATAQRDAAHADASRNAFLQGLRDQIALFGLSTDEVLRYRAAQNGAATAADPLIAKLRDLRLAQEQATYGERMLAQAQREAAQTRNGQDSFVKGLEQQAAAIGKTRIELLELQAAQLGVTNRAKPFIDQLRAADHAMQGGGMSAAAMNAALRGVPAQMTDIIVSLQGGQAPLTVFLQQGGQLKDMFGGIVPAAKALGGAVLNLINPFTVTIAAVATGALAFKAGHDETLRYSRALAMTGNFAGTTSLQMADMANNIGEVSGSQRVAAAALTILAGTGAIASQNLEWFGTVAVDAQHVLGKSVEDTAKEFADLGKSPLTALQAIADKYHFVTAETYAQVKALQEQGRSLEAANVAQRAYADGVNGQRQKVLDSLSDWERGWLRIKKAVSGAVDSTIDFFGGREEGNQQKITALLKQREEMEERIARLRASGQRRDGDNYDESKDRDLQATRALLTVNEREINSIRSKAQASKDAGAAEAAAVRADELRNKWLDEANTLLTRRQLLERDLKAARKEGADNGLDEAEIQGRLEVIRRKYNDVFVAGIDSSMTALRKRGELEDVLSQRALAQVQAQRDAGDITEDDALRRTAALQLAQIDAAKRGLQEQLGLTRAKINSEREQLDLQGQIAKLGEERISREKQLEDDLAAAQRNRSQASLDLYMQGVEAANAEVISLEEQVKAQRLTNEEIGLSKEAVAVLRAERMIAIAVLKEQTAAEIEAMDAGSATAEAYRRQAVELRNLALAKQQGVVNEGIDDANKKAQESLKEFLDPTRAQTFGEALRESFGVANDSITKMTSSLDSFGRRQAKIAAERANAEMLHRNGKKTEVEYLEIVDQLNRESTKNHLASYGSMTSAAAGFFGEQSRGYKALQAASQVFHAAELAMTLAELVPKGIAAVLNQGNGDPYSAPVRMAAMAAIVTGLGVAIGGIGGGGPNLTEERQKVQGTGSVLGSDAKSESITRSLDAIEGATLQGLGISNGMLTSLRNIEAGIEQFASLLVRTTGVTGDFGSDMSKNVFDSKAIGIGGAAGGAVLGAMGGAYLGMGTSQIGLMLGGPVGMALGAALGAVIGKTFIGKALGSVFGGKQTVEDTGFTVGKTDFASIFGGGLNAMQYADIKKDGGWFRSDKYSTKTEGLGEEGNRQISSVLMSLYDTVFEAGQMIGIGADGFAAQLNGFVVDIGKVSLKGLTDDEIQKELEAVFSKVGDDLAKFGVGGLEQFQKVGEGYLETLARVATNYQAVTVVTDSMGMTFGALGVASIGARERLIDLVGGLDEFTSGADQFLADFYTDQERANSLHARITPTLDQFGIKTGAEDSLQQFRGVVTGLDLTTEAGARAYATLIQIAPAFKQIADVDAKIFEERADLQKELDQLTLTETQLLAQQRAALDESNRSLFDQIQAIKAQKTAAEQAAEAIEKANQQAKDTAAALLSSVDGQFGVLQRVVDRQKKALQEDIQMRTEAVGKLKSMSDALRSTLDGMRTPEQQEADRAGAQAEIRAALAIARAGGPLPDSEKLQRALAAVGNGPSTDGYATLLDYQRDLFGTQGDLAELAKLTDGALTVEEKSLKSLEDQVKQYDLMLERYQEQIDVLKGISVTGLSIEQAIFGLQGALEAAKANPVVSATSAISDAYKSSLGRAPDAAGMDFWKDKAASGVSTGAIVGAIKGSPEAQLQALYRELFGRAADAGGLQFYLTQMGKGTSLAEVREALLSSDEAKKKLRGFAVGTNYVPVDMPAQIHQGERIIPAADNRELMRRLASPPENNEVLAAAVDRLTATVERQERTIADLQVALDKTQGNTKRLADGMEIVTDGWNAARVKQEATA
jgi:phage-related minor tail protein